MGRVAGTRAPGWPCQRRVGAWEGRKEREGGWEGGRPGESRGGGIVLFRFGGVNHTGSGSGRRELGRSGFASVNCLEAGWFFMLAWRARADGRAGEMPGCRAGGSAGPGGRSQLRGGSGGSFPWSDGGLEALGMARAGGRWEEAALGRHRDDHRSCSWPPSTACLVEVRASPLTPGRDLALLHRSSPSLPGRNRARGFGPNTRESALFLSA